MVFKQWAAVTLLACAAGAHAYEPQAGTWVVTSEVNGKPGRGLSVDVQNGTLALQMYAYENNGQPTFYLAVGDVTDNQVTARLNRYAGGRYFGSPALSGTEAGSPGNVTIRFTSGTTGFITFPNEPEKAISRFNFGYPQKASSLAGIWTFTSVGSEGTRADAALLDTPLAGSSNGNGLLASSDGLFGCEHQVSGTLAGSVLCVRVNSSGTLQRAYVMNYSIHDGEGYSQAAGSRTQQFLVVRRVATARGDGTGIALKSGESADGTAPPALLQAALRFHLEAVALQAPAP
ncbi:hypothetical protein [Paracidovorax cattleyae]|uniref:Lipocalin-like domain-containing protein n=1 Tax=Paracidovorax cattleyae TaxID=80868 RepID=A0A1H0V413_9BURK|nr:hypothetical protein [Paracidovorax cattleyae]AVS72767.1 hypothetical protein C8240_00690 [Paracidovorax cattleyae]SDP73279.1 hypothetical protein SAMN04489708_12358 [Paracidovorax cattleyae]